MLKWSATSGPNNSTYSWKTTKHVGTVLLIIRQFIPVYMQVAMMAGEPLHSTFRLRRLDYTCDFLLAEIYCKDFEIGIYISMHVGFGQQGKVLKLKKSLYSMKWSARNYFQHFKAKLELVGSKIYWPFLVVSDKWYVLFMWMKLFSFCQNIILPKKCLETQTASFLTRIFMAYYLACGRLKISLSEKKVIEDSITQLNNKFGKT